MAYQFEKLEVWKLALEYLDQLYDIAEKMPAGDAQEARSRLTGAAYVIVHGIAQGSTGAYKSEQSGRLEDAHRAILESVACLHIIKRRRWVSDIDLLRRSYRNSQSLYGKLLGMRRALDPALKAERPERTVINDDPWPDD